MGGSLAHKAGGSPPHEGHNMPAFIDITGDTYGDLVVLERVGTKGPMWLCRCSCGNTVEVEKDNLRLGRTTSCGCHRAEANRKRLFKDLTGQRFHSLVVIEQSSNKGRRTAWLCLCDCGNENVVSGTNLQQGLVKSCGCALGRITATPTSHGLSRTVEHRAWRNAKYRVLNPNSKNYPDYGGRGIDMDPRWVESFQAFYDEVGPKPDPSLSLDRIDNDRGYWPGNVRWATRSEQQSNQRQRRNGDPQASGREATAPVSRPDSNSHEG